MERSERRLQSCRVLIGLARGQIEERFLASLGMTNTGSGNDNWWREPTENDKSVGPVGADAAGGVLAVDSGVDLAAEEEGEPPVEGVGDGVGAGKAVGYTDGAVTREGVGVGYGESERTTGAVCTLIRGRRHLRGGWTVEEGEVGAGGKPGGSGVQEKDSVRTGVQESAVGVVVESGGDVHG